MMDTKQPTHCPVCGSLESKSVLDMDEATNGYDRRCESCETRYSADLAPAQLTRQLAKIAGLKIATLALSKELGNGTGITREATLTDRDTKYLDAAMDDLLIAMNKRLGKMIETRRRTVRGIMKED